MTVKVAASVAKTAIISVGLIKDRLKLFFFAISVYYESIYFSVAT